MVSLMMLSRYGIVKKFEILLKVRSHSKNIEEDSIYPTGRRKHAVCD